MPNPTAFDHYLNEDGPAALVLREHLMPAEGTGGYTVPRYFCAPLSPGAHPHPYAA